jgi:hypothetical protein
MLKEIKKAQALIKIQVTQQEIQEAMKHIVHRNKKKYRRKVKHKNQSNEKEK